MSPETQASLSSFTPDVPVSGGPAVAGTGPDPIPGDPSPATGVGASASSGSDHLSGTSSTTAFSTTDPFSGPPATVSNQEPESGPSPTKLTHRYWHLATNQLNLMYLLAAGLITGPRGFGRKYYRDALGALPGLIPLFAERIPVPVLQEAVAEGPHLRSVIALIDLAALRGPVLTMTPDGKLCARDFPAGLVGDEDMLLVPAPLPAHWITSLLFASAQHKAATQAEAAAYANVPLADYKQQVKARLFAGDALLTWPPSPCPASGLNPASPPVSSVALDLSAIPDPSPGHVSAVGAALALLFALGNTGAATAAAARALWALPLASPDASAPPLPPPGQKAALGVNSDANLKPSLTANLDASPSAILNPNLNLNPSASLSATLNASLDANCHEAARYTPNNERLSRDFHANPDPILRALRRWALKAPETEMDGVQATLLQRLLTALVEAADSTRQCPPDPRQVVLEVLTEEATRLAEPKWRDALSRLGQDLRGSITLGDATISELLQRHPRPFSRGLLLFFLRERCEELLAFRHPALTAQDQVVAAALFAAHWGWMALPASLRAVRGLTPAVQHRMAALAHQQGATGIDLGPAPPPMLPLRALLESAPPKAAQTAALRLARGMGCENEVLTTRISLGKGDYRLTIDGRGAHLLLAGDVKAVSSEVDQAALLARLAAAEIPGRLEAELRELLDTGVGGGALTYSARAGRVARIADADCQDDDP